MYNLNFFYTAAPVVQHDNQFDSTMCKSLLYFNLNSLAPCHYILAKLMDRNDMQIWLKW